MASGAATLRLAAMLVFGLLPVAAGCGYTVSDTGYLGTWEREVVPGRFSRIALWEQDGQTLFCWSTRGKTRGETVRCTPGGNSETVVGREVIYEYRFTVRPVDGDDEVATTGDDAGVEILVDAEGVPRREGTTPIRWTDRLAVQPGGMELRSYRIRLNGKEMNNVRSPLSFSKVADIPI